MLIDSQTNEVQLVSANMGDSHVSLLWHLQITLLEDERALFKSYCVALLVNLHILCTSRAWCPYPCMCTVEHLTTTSNLQAYVVIHKNLLSLYSCRPVSSPYIYSYMSLWIHIATSQSWSIGYRACRWQPGLYLAARKVLGLQLMWWVAQIESSQSILVRAQ